MATKSFKALIPPGPVTSRHPKLSAFTDGGARGNPGPAALGVVLYAPGGELVFEVGEYLGERTNNQAEYAALVRALLEAQRLGARILSCYLDSELVVRQLAGIYRVKDPDLRKLFEKAKHLACGFERVTFEHVPREHNKEADRLVNQALDHAATEKG